MRYETQLAAVVIVFIAVAVLQPFACTKPQEAKRILTEENFTDIEVGEYTYFNWCGKGFPFANQFKATSPSGSKTEGIVCCDFSNHCSVHH